jgi:hypothetical protein
MREVEKKIHVLNNSRLRKIRYNLRSILYLEFKKRQQSLIEERRRVHREYRGGKISEKEYVDKKRELLQKKAELTNLVLTNPIRCTMCKSRRNDLEQDEDGIYYCYLGRHELDDRGINKPTSPFVRK